jgi:hypothetical protein
MQKERVHAAIAAKQKEYDGWGPLHRQIRAYRLQVPPALPPGAEEAFDAAAAVIVMGVISAASGHGETASGHGETASGPRPLALAPPCPGKASEPWRSIHREIKNMGGIAGNPIPFPPIRPDVPYGPLAPPLRASWAAEAAANRAMKQQKELRDRWAQQDLFMHLDDDDAILAHEEACRFSSDVLQGDAQFFLELRRACWAEGAARIEAEDLARRNFWVACGKADGYGARAPGHAAAAAPAAAASGYDARAPGHAAAAAPAAAASGYGARPLAKVAMEAVLKKHREWGPLHAEIRMNGDMRHSLLANKHREWGPFHAELRNSSGAARCIAAQAAEAAKDEDAESGYTPYYESRNAEGTIRYRSKEDKESDERMLKSVAEERAAFGSAGWASGRAWWASGPPSGEAPGNARAKASGHGKGKK